MEKIELIGLLRAYIGIILVTSWMTWYLLTPIHYHSFYFSLGEFLKFMGGLI